MKLQENGVLIVGLCDWNTHIAIAAVDLLLGVRAILDSESAGKTFLFTTFSRGVHCLFYSQLNVSRVACSCSRRFDGH